MAGAAFWQAGRSQGPPRLPCRLPGGLPIRLHRHPWPVQPSGRRGEAKVRRACHAAFRAAFRFGCTAIHGRCSLLAGGAKPRSAAPAMPPSGRPSDSAAPPSMAGAAFWQAGRSQAAVLSFKGGMVQIMLPEKVFPGGSGFRNFRVASRGPHDSPLRSMAVKMTRISSCMPSARAWAACPWPAASPRTPG